MGYCPTDLSKSQDSLPLFRNIFEGCADAIVVIHQDQTIGFVNASAEDMFGRSRFDMLGQNLDILVPERFRACHHGMVEAFSSHQSPARFMRERQVELSGLHSSGHEFPIDVSILKSGDGLAPMMAAIIRDITEQKKAEDHLKMLANTDSLTGILNRRSFLERAEQELDRSRRYGHPLSVAMIDVDHFKRINDRFGHAFGDCALKHIVSVISNQLRLPDILGRLGGEEFGVLLTSVEGADAAIPAERYRRAVEQSPVTTPEKSDPVQLTISVGVACLGPDCGSVDLMLQKADKALYGAKSAGRNRVQLAECNRPSADR